MEPTDIIDDVNTLLKLGVGDAYRLEHIKQAYIENKTIWKTDSSYLERLKEKYLTKIHSDVQEDSDKESENNSEDREIIHCWKCGKKCPLGANFCMACGTSLFEVRTESQASKNASFNSRKNTKSIGLKIPIMICIPVLILIALGIGYSQGSFDNVLEKQILDNSVEDEIDPKDSINKEITSSDPNSKCGEGTVFDEDTNSCVLEGSSSQNNPNSKCGEGTVFDEDTNSCVLEK